MIILHGLLGCSDNWWTVAKDLSDDFEVFIPDQRNHGKSFHSPEIDYNLLAGDLYDFIELHSIKNPVLVGHSMGGKVVIKFLSMFPELASSAIVVDIAPKKYHFENPAAMEIRSMVDAMINLDMGMVKSLKDATALLKADIPNPMVLNFVLKNLERGNQNDYFWRINIHALRNNLFNFLESPFDNSFKGKIGVPTMFIRGARSGYIQFEDFELIKSFFLNSQIVTIPDASHWVHFEQRELLVDSFRLFIEE